MTLFIDEGYSNPDTFCIQFLQSPDFKFETLKKFTQRSFNKASAATDVARKVMQNRIDTNRLMLEYAKQSRQWFTLKTGNGPDIFKGEDPEDLLTEFGEENWYGPVFNDEDDSYFYFRNHSIDEFKIINNQIERVKIRWLVVANVSDSYLSLNWNGFTTNSDENIDSRHQFQFWNYIPSIISEIEDLLEAEYDQPVFHRLILEDIWDKYIPDPNYTWNHLAVRAEASGVALNARSSGIQQINVSGLLSLVNKIAESVVNDIEEAIRPQGKIRNKSRKRYLVERTENIIIKTLIKDWGTKSYEFRLQTEDEKLFRAHSYFGLKPQGNTQDCFPHFKAYRESGGAYKAIQFLLNEMEEL